MTCNLSPVFNVILDKSRRSSGLSQKGQRQEKQECTGGWYGFWQNPELAQAHRLNMVP